MNGFEDGWVVGFLEGEGSFTCISYQHRRTRNGKTTIRPDFTILIRATSTDLDALQKLRQTTGIGEVKSKKLSSELSKKPQWEWRVQKRNELREFLPAIKPFMTHRRKEAIDKMLDKLGPLV